MPLKYNLLIKILKDFDFTLMRTNGSHHRYQYNSYGITVPFHDEFTKKTAKSILTDVSKISGIEYEKIIKEYNIKL